MFVLDEVAETQAVKQAWINELSERLPEMIAQWRTVAPDLFGAVTAITGKKIVPPQIIRLTLTEIPSNSFSGVTVNMRYTLRSFTATPVPLRYKIDGAFHEALHEFVSNYSPVQSGLLSQQSSESDCVRSHLHLLALQKAVLLRVGDVGALDQVVTIDSRLPNGCYKRAWSIVNAKPSTYLQYVAELSK